MIRLTDAENEKLGNLYSVMHPLMDRYRLANYHMTIQKARKAQNFFTTRLKPFTGPI